MDLPSYLEASYVCTTLTKTLWVFVYIAVYGVRPLIVRPKPQGALWSLGARVLAILTMCCHVLSSHSRSFQGSCQASAPDSAVPCG